MVAEKPKEKQTTVSISQTEDKEDCYANRG
jgi:hypothetical protein